MVIFPFLNRKKVYALIGGPGTGKSFHSKFVAQKYNIDLIIDDGLLIKDNRILAGHSAKKESSFLTAVKVALFDDKSHRDEVARRLQNEKYNNILILGTSEKMAAKIAVRLQLNLPKKIIRIEEIATQDEIEKALRTRRIEGKHIIPVPSIEVKKSYPNIFYNAIRIFRKKKVSAIKTTDSNTVNGINTFFISRIIDNTGIGGAPTLHEKSIVRPEYSRRSKVIITETALGHMVTNCTDEFNKNIKIKKINVKDADMGYRLVITIDIPYGIQLDDNIKELQAYIIENIERYTGILIEEVNIIIDKITE